MKAGRRIQVGGEGQEMRKTKDHRGDVQRIRSGVRGTTETKTEDKDTA